MNARKKLVHAVAFANFAPVVAPSHFTKIPLQMFGAHPMVNAVHLPLEQTPNTLYRIHMDILTATIFIIAVPNGLMIIAALNPSVDAVFISEKL